MLNPIQIRLLCEIRRTPGGPDGLPWRSETLHHRLYRAAHRPVHRAQRPSSWAAGCVMAPCVAGESSATVRNQRPPTRFRRSAPQCPPLPAPAAERAVVPLVLL